MNKYDISSNLNKYLSVQFDIPYSLLVGYIFIEYSFSYSGIVEPISRLLDSCHDTANSFSTV